MAQRADFNDHSNGAVAATQKRPAMHYVLWLIQVLIGALFVFAGVMKLITPIEEMTKQMALPGLLLRFIGVIEILGGLGLILPGLFGIQRGLTALAALGLVVVMIGATVVTIMSVSVLAALFPFVVGLLLLFVAYARWRVYPLR